MQTIKTIFQAGLTNLCILTYKQCFHQKAFVLFVDSSNPFTASVSSIMNSYSFSFSGPSPLYTAVHVDAGFGRV